MKSGVRKATSPRKHSRIEKSVLVRLADIEAKSFDYDPQYTSLVIKQHKGEVPTSLTRLSEAAITSGFFARRDGKTVLISNLEFEYLPAIIAKIRGGWRPRLSIYWSALSPKQSKYVCPDDEPALAAYRRLGFRLVPCAIMKPKPIASVEAAIWIRNEKNSVNWVRTVRPNVDALMTLAIPQRASFGYLAERLIRECELTRKAIKKFHLKDRDGTNYHHVLYAALRRQERIVDSLSRLISLHRAEHAAALLRVSYEAFLNFYIDWISPDFFGPRLQFLSLIKKSSRKQGIKIEDHPNFDALTNMVQLLTRVADKGRMSPLSEVFHDRVYSSLSLVAHQDYGHLEAEANDFSDRQRRDRQSYVKQLGLCLNAITMALLTRVRNEIGQF